MTKPLSDRAGRRRETHERLSEAARRAFLAQGYEGVTYRALAQAAGVSTGAYFGLWPSKEAMFRDVMGADPPDVPAFLERVAIHCTGYPGALSDLAEDALTLRRLLIGSGP